MHHSDFPKETSSTTSSRRLFSGETQDLLSSKARVSFQVAISALKFLNRAQNTPNPPLEKVKPFPIRRKLVSRPSLVTAEKLEKSIDFAENLEDQKTVTGILVVRPQKRFQEEVIFLQKAFQNLTALKELQGQLDEASFQKIFRAMDIQSFRAGDTISQGGKLGSNLYILIKGSVYVLMKSAAKKSMRDSPTKASIGDDEEEERKRIRIGETLDKSNLKTIKKEIAEAQNPDFEVIDKILQGNTFGEVAIWKNGEKKEEIILCPENTLMAVLDHKDYLEILSSSQKKKYSENFKFLQTVDLIKKWKHVNIELLAKAVEEKKYLRNQVILREGEYSDCIYFIKQGEIELQKNTVKENNKEKTFDGSTTRKKVEGGWKRSRKLRVAIMVRGGLFGESELSSNNCQEYSAIVYSSEALLLSVSRNVFNNLIKDKQTLQTVEKNLKEKKVWRHDLLAKIVDYNREGSRDQNLSIIDLAGSPKKFQKSNRNAEEYFGLNTSPNLLLQSPSSAQKSEEAKTSLKNKRKFLTMRAPQTTRHLNSKDANENSASSSNLKNYFLDQCLNQQEQPNESISKLPISEVFLKRKISEYPHFVKQKRVLEETNKKKRGKMISKNTAHSQFNKNETNFYFGRMSAEPSLNLQPESNQSSPIGKPRASVFEHSTFSQNDEIIQKEKEEKSRPQNPMIRIMKSLGLEKVLQVSSPTPRSGLNIVPYSDSSREEYLLTVRSNTIQETKKLDQILVIENAVRNPQNFSDLRNPASPISISKMSKGISFDRQPIEEFLRTPSYR